jgi:hypothetical protein
MRLRGPKALDDKGHKGTRRKAIWRSGTPAVKIPRLAFLDTIRGLVTAGSVEAFTTEDTEEHRGKAKSSTTKGTKDTKKGNLVMGSIW